MASTQEHLNVSEVRDDVVILKNGDMAIILQTNAVNFGLLSDNEQLAIIGSFAGLLNSLSFSIQIVVRSKRLDISSYLKTLDQALLRQTNPLLSEMIKRYHKFIESTVRENEVLDKQFYIIVPLSHLEIGLKGDFKKAMALLLPRRDHLIRQLSRCGLQADQLGNEELINLFYDIYNQRDLTVKQPEVAVPQPQQMPVMPPQPQPAVAAVLQATAPQAASPTPIATQPASEATQPVSPAQTSPLHPQQPAPTASPPPPPNVPQYSPPIRRKPFVVEELPDDYGTAVS